NLPEVSSYSAILSRQSEEVQRLDGLQLEVAHRAAEEARHELAPASRLAVDADVGTRLPGPRREPDPVRAVPLDDDRVAEEPQPPEQHRAFPFQHLRTFLSRVAHERPMARPGRLIHPPRAVDRPG